MLSRDYREKGAVASEPECQPLEDLLNGKKARLAEVEALLDDTEAACEDAGYTGDACILYIKLLKREDAQLKIDIPVLQQELDDCEIQEESIYLCSRTQMEIVQT